MILISHRGNINGKIPEKENTQEYIQQALDLGYHVEIDIWRENNKLFLGHDNAENEVEERWLLDRREKLWVHAKNPDALFHLTYETIPKEKCLCVFFHENDRYTIIQNERNKHGVLVDGLIWAHDTRKINSKCIIPILDKTQCEAFRFDRSYDTSVKNLGEGVFGVCSDYIELLNENR